MVRRITNLDNHNLRVFFTNADQLHFLIRLYINYNAFFPAQIVYLLRDCFFLRFEFYYNCFSYFFSLVISVWHISDFTSKNTDELIFFKHVWYLEQNHFYFLNNIYFRKVPKINKKITFRFIFLLLEHSVIDYRALFRKCIHNECMFKFQKLFKIEQEYAVVFREYHSKYRDELFFEHKYRPYLPRLKNMIFNFDNLSKLKKPFFNYFEQRKYNAFIDTRNFFNNHIQRFLPLIGVFKFYEWQLKFLYFYLVLIKTKNIIKSIYIFSIYKKKFIYGAREPLVGLFDLKLKNLLFIRNFILFRFIVNESSCRNRKKRHRKIAKFVKIVRVYRCIKKRVVWSFRICKRMFNLFFWFFFTLHLIACIDYFIEFHFLTEERVFILLYEYFEKKYKEIYDFFFTFY